MRRDPGRGHAQGGVLASIEANTNYYHARYVAQSNDPQGVCDPYVDYQAGDGKYTHSMWMEDFFTAAWGYTLDLDLGLSASAKSNLQSFFAWKSLSIVGRLGGSAATEYGYRDAAQYTVAVAPSDSPNWDTGAGPWYSDWGQIYTATTGQTNTASSATDLRGAYYPDPTIPASQNGVYTRFTYVPRLGGVVYCPAYDSGLWFLRVV